MKERRLGILVVAILVGYAFLLTAIMRFLAPPWNWAVASLVIFKGLVFWAVASRANGLGRGRRRTPPR